MQCEEELACRLHPTLSILRSKEEQECFLLAQISPYLHTAPLHFRWENCLRFAESVAEMSLLEVCIPG